jgi:hypothetical protein
VASRCENLFGSFLERKPLVVVKTKRVEISKGHLTSLPSNSRLFGRLTTTNGALKIEFCFSHRQVNIAVLIEH